MAYKVFANGFPLTASEINGYLMNQSVMVFANSSARSSALTSPTEGMVTYLEDTNSLEVYTGASWTAVGASPITTQGDLILGNASGVAARLAIGSNNTYLKSNGTTASWAALSGLPGNWTSLASGSISTGASSFTVSSLTSKSNYLIMFFEYGSTSASYYKVALNGDQTMTIRGLRTNNDPSTNSQINFANSSNFLARNEFVGNYMSSIIYLEAADSTAPCRIQIFSGNSDTNDLDFNYLSMGLATKNSQALSSVTLSANTGNLNGGTYEIWGR